MGIPEIYECYQRSYKVVKDTRLDVGSAMYFSLKGGNFNGNRYAREALDKGASYAVIDEESYLTDERMILVDDALVCLQELALYHRQRLGIPVIALTGSNGKTTTKELISAVLAQKYRCHATAGNLNNHIGVPLTLLDMRPGTEIAVVEMGANHPGEIEALCDIAMPDFGFITNFGRVHLEGFGSLEGVIKAKTEMYAHLRKYKKVVFVNALDKVQMERSAGMSRITFGTPEAEIPVTFIKADPFVRLSFDETEVHSALIGSYNYSNMAAAVAIGTHFEVEPEQIKKSIESYIPSNNRSQLVNKGSNKIILDAYNANPNSMEAALQNLDQLNDPRKIAVLGDMFELGETALAEHQRIADVVKDLGIEEAFLIGNTFSKVATEDDKIKVFTSYEEFKDHLDTCEFSGATFLIKASRGMALERVLDLL